MRNKRKSQPIVTLTPAFLKKLTSQSDWVIRVVVGTLLDDVGRILGTRPTLDFEQEFLLLERIKNQTTPKLESAEALLSTLAAGVAASSLQHHELRAIFLEGLKHSASRDIETALDLATQFDSMLQADAEQ